MSIVERAIKRLQGETAPAKTQRAFGTVIEVAIPQAPVRRMITIDQDALRQAGLLAPKHQERQVASQYRIIKRPLIATAQGKGSEPIAKSRLIMVASSLPGEGKTFTAINLAFSMAMEKDLHVVLVDGDVAKPQITRMFGIEGERGLLDAVADPALDMESLILATDVPNLFLLSAGKFSEQATELLSSDRMTQTMERLLGADKSRIILFDSPPLLLTTEASALAQVVGQVVVVVRAESTKQQVLFDALSHLPEGCTPSLILNQSTANSSASYSYGYGYGYGTQEDT